MLLKTNLCDLNLQEIHYRDINAATDVYHTDDTFLDYIRKMEDILIKCYGISIGLLT